METEKKLFDIQCVHKNKANYFLAQCDQTATKHCNIWNNNFKKQLHV